MPAECLQPRGCGSPNLAAEPLISRVSKWTVCFLRQSWSLFRHSIIPRLRDSREFSPSGKGPQCHEFCFNKEILILKKKKTCQVAMATIYLWSWGWWYSVIFLPRKSKLDIAKNLIKVFAGREARIWQFLGTMTGFKYTTGDPPVITPAPSIKLKDFDLDTNTSYSYTIQETQFSEQVK